MNPDETPYGDTPEAKEARRKWNEMTTDINTEADAINANNRKIHDLEYADKKLKDIVAENKDAAPDVKFQNPVVTPTGTDQSDESDSGGGHDSGGDSAAEEAAMRREAAKATEDFQQSAERFAKSRAEADRLALAQYRAGTIEYKDLVLSRLDNEKEYCNNMLILYEQTFADQKDTYLKDDKDYQALLKAKEKNDAEYEKQLIALELEAIDRRKSAEEQSAQHNFDVRSNPTLADEVNLQAELYNIRKKALEDKRELYAEGSKEYADIQYEMGTLENSHELEQKKLYFKAVSEIRKEYDKKSAAEKFKLEKATLDAVRDANKLSAEEYAEYLKGLTEKYKKDLPGGEEEDGVKGAVKKYDKEVQELQAALAAGELTQEEFESRMAKIRKDRNKSIADSIKQAGGEWNGMIANIYTAFDNLFNSFGGKTEDVLRNIADCTAAVSSAITAGMQIASEFAKAESEIQLAEIEKRYSREIELAQGNSYKVAKLEKKKEEETAKVKNKASKKQYDMQIIQAIAQSLTAGLNAYASTLAIPVVGPALAPAAMAVALAMGAVQVALLKKQQQAAQAKGYSQGGFTKKGGVNEPAGVVHAGEWVASQRLLANPVARPMIEALDYAQRTNTIGSLRADDVSRSITANNSLVRIAEGDGAPALMVAAALRMSQTVDSLTSRLNEPFVTVNTVTGDKGIKQAQDEYARLMNNKSPKKR